MLVVNCTLYRDNPYQRTLYAALEGRYEGIRGTVDDALTRLRGGEATLLHVHWEEHVIRPCRTIAEARAAADYFMRGIQQFSRLGGRIVWTVHNGMPHELEYPQVFLQIRKCLATCSDRILVHNTEAINVLSQQAPLDRRRIYFLPHPSYLGTYETEEAAEAGIMSPVTSRILAFGKIRRYKGFGRLIEMLPPDFLAQHGATLQISGEPIKNDDYLPELQQRFGARQDVAWDIRSVPDAEVPALLRSVRCVVLPYERFLTSGVALLALSVGAIVVGPATMPLREVLPVPVQRFLFRQDDEQDFRRAIAEVMALSPAEIQEVRQAMLKRARYLHPRRIGLQLGGVYDALLQEAPQAVAAAPV